MVLDQQQNTGGIKNRKVMRQLGQELQLLIVMKKMDFFRFRSIT